MHASPPPRPVEHPDAVVLYSRPGCHLCDDAHATLSTLLAQRAATGRAAPPIVERDITTDPDWERRFLVTIPVIEIGRHRLELATSPTRIRALLDAALDAADALAADATGSAATPSAETSGRA